MKKETKRSENLSSMTDFFHLNSSDLRTNELFLVLKFSIRISTCESTKHRFSNSVLARNRAQWRMKLTVTSQKSKIFNLIQSHKHTSLHLETLIHNRIPFNKLFFSCPFTSLIMRLSWLTTFDFTLETSN